MRKCATRQGVTNLRPSGAVTMKLRTPPRPSWQVQCWQVMVHGPGPGCLVASMLDWKQRQRQETGGRRQEAGWVPGSVGKRRRAEPRQFCSLVFAMSDFAMPGSVSHRARGHVHDVWSCCPRGMAGARWCKCAGPRFGWPVDGVEHLKAPGSASQSPRARLA